jgi:hypothetical protein
VEEVRLPLEPADHGKRLDREKQTRRALQPDRHVLEVTESSVGEEGEAVLVLQGRDLPWPPQEREDQGCPRPRAAAALTKDWKE